MLVNNKKQSLSTYVLRYLCCLVRPSSSDFNFRFVLGVGATIGSEAKLSTFTFVTAAVGTDSVISNIYLRARVKASRLRVQALRV